MKVLTYTEARLSGNGEHATSNNGSGVSLSTLFTVVITPILVLIGFFWIRSKLLESLNKNNSEFREFFIRETGTTRENLLEKMSQDRSELFGQLDRSLAQSRTELRDGLIKASESLEARVKGLQGDVNERLETIGKNVETKLEANLKEGFQHFEKVQIHLKAAELQLASLHQVGQSISDLNSLLKLPHLRGGFGESSLERILSDFIPVGSYELQYTIVPGTQERVDAVVKLPRKLLPIDSKFSRESVLALFEGSNPEELENARKALSEVTRTQAKSIATKYIRPDHNTTDMALLFLPSETLYFEVIRNTKLFEELTKLKVFPVSPNTLAITLHSIAVAQEYYELARGVEKTIEDIRRARKHFDHFENRFDEVGKGLQKAQEAYTTAQSHLGRYESSVIRLTGDADQLEETKSIPPPDPIQ